MSITDHYTTPPWIIDLARRVGSGICLDPCSNKASVVGAQHSWSLVDGFDGLNLPWSGRATRDGLIWVNPPYSDPLPWMRKCYEESTSPENESVHIVALVKHDHTTEWWKEYALRADARVELEKRVAFGTDLIMELDPEAKAGGAPPWPSTLLYWGPAPMKFIRVFNLHGSGILHRRVARARCYIDAEL